MTFVAAHRHAHGRASRIWSSTQRKEAAIRIIRWISASMVWRTSGFVSEFKVPVLDCVAVELCRVMCKYGSGVYSQIAVAKIL